MLQVKKILLNVAMLSVIIKPIMLNVILGVAIKPIMQNVRMLLRLESQFSRYVECCYMFLYADYHANCKCHK